MRHRVIAMKTTFKYMLAALLLVAFSAGYARQEPDQLIKSAVTVLLARYESEQKNPDRKPGYLRAMIDELILPHVDFVFMSRLVLGRHWRTASASQREQFTNGFRELLIRTYTKPLSKYSGQEIRFKPFRPGDDSKLATVNTEIVPPGGTPIPVNYKLRLNEPDRWKVYDITVDSLSMVTNYRSTYARVIARDGLDKLIASLSSAKAQ